ncbi:hypothetical protein HF086_005201 [Spodoptera exigua]|uniref:Uncharacterized protein n=1 Tax=Spodoptera exigua TaxID=7107 RepID=A0A922MZ34_SPOEX|nr:hypothetical protein HF086_005201 [Spodoptera exigua]
MCARPVCPQPLQLGSEYRAVCSLVGAAPPSPPPPAPPPTCPRPPAIVVRVYCDLCEILALIQLLDDEHSSRVCLSVQPRSVISSSFNGLPLSRPNYGATGNSAPEEYKKSLDENGNSVQGFSSPLSGSSQHKKPRRKKSSKNETVIDCQQIDGYQGDKDVNELLRFIESNADNGRGPKLGRVKHKDDSDDKSGKKRSTERRKDKENKIKRATSMEELSRTKIEDLTDVTESPLRSDKKERRSDVPNKAERRSWGDDARDTILYSDPPDCPAAAELTDFQTVTKKRKPRRRTDEPEPAPRRTRPPSPRPRRESAPPSDRSNDSNDDMDSVHSLPGAPPAPPAAPPPAQASYADIARTRHNIPDLIESCNFYGDGAAPPAAAPADADGYPALDARQAARRRDKAPTLRARSGRRRRPTAARPRRRPRRGGGPAPRRHPAGLGRAAAGHGRRHLRLRAERAAAGRRRATAALRAGAGGAVAAALRPGARRGGRGGGARGAERAAVRAAGRAARRRAAAAAGGLRGRRLGRRHARGALQAALLHRVTRHCSTYVLYDIGKKLVKT